MHTRVSGVDLLRQVVEMQHRQTETESETELQKDREGTERDR